MAAPSPAVLLRLSSDACPLLPDPTRQLRHLVLNDSHWHFHPLSSDTPAVPLSDLLPHLQTLAPSQFFLHLPCDSPLSLPTCHLRPLLILQQAFRSLPSPTLTFYTSPPSQVLRHYRALFATQHHLTSSAAASVLSAAAFPLPSFWQGPIHIPPVDPADQPTSLPGFRLVPIAPQPEPNQPQSSHHSHLRILATSPSLPPIAALLPACPAYRLVLSQDVSTRSALLFNELAQAAHSLLVAVGSTLLWLYWRPASPHIHQCHALAINPLPPSALSALDTPSLCAKFQITDQLNIPQLPSPLLHLHTSPLNPSSHANPTSTFDALLKSRQSPSLHQFITILSQKPRHVPSSRPNTPAHPPKQPNPRDLDALIDDLSRAELRALILDQRLRKQLSSDPVLSVPRLSNSLTRSDSQSLLDSKLLSRKDPKHQPSQLTMRRQRFHRLLQSQHDKRGVETANTVSSLGQRGKRVRSTELDMSGRRYTKSSRSIPTSQVSYASQLLRGKISSLEQCPVFFRLNSPDHIRSLTSAQIGAEVSHLHSDGVHGVEYMLDADDRDRHIVEFETLVRSAGQEFSAPRPLSHQQQAKLQSAISELNQLATDADSVNMTDIPPYNVPQTKTHIDSPAETLRSVLQAFLDGRIVVKDDALRVTLQNAASIRL